MELGSVVRDDRFVMFDFVQLPYSSTSSSSTISAPSPLRGPSFKTLVWSLKVSRGNVIKKLHYYLRITEAPCGHSAGMHLIVLVCAFCHCDQLLRCTAHRGRLGLCRANTLISKQIGNQVAPQRIAMSG
jgi:hypothetical protein